MKPVPPLAGLLACVLAASASSQSKVDFASQVWPILSKSCVRCHQAPHKDRRGRMRKPKGGLRLDGKNWILAGSEDGPVLVPGHADKSSLYKRTILPKDDDDHMPAKGSMLTKSQTETLRRWIEGGADFGTWVGEAGPKPAAPKAKARKTAAAPVTRSAKGGAAKPGASLVEVWKALGAGVAPASASTIEKAIGELGQVTPLFDGSPLLRVSFLSSEEKIGQEQIAALTPLAGNIAELELGRCSHVGDDALAVIGEMPHLTRLDLHQTAVTDKGLFRIAGLSELRYLNLHGTKLSDEGVQVLGRLAKLQALYLWKTGVTTEGVGMLRKRLPHTNISSTLKLPDPPAGGQDNNRRRRRR